MADFVISKVDNRPVLLPEWCIKFPNRDLLKTMSAVHQLQCERIRNAYVSKRYYVLVIGQYTTETHMFRKDTMCW